MGSDDKARHLVRLIREEALRVWTRPISSDAFTGFGIHNHRIHNAEARGLSQALIEERIPVFANELATHKKDVTNGRQLVDLMHAAGLNVRWIALVYMATMVNVKRLRQSSSSLSSDGFVANLLLTEMISRSIKLIIRDVMREALPKAVAPAAAAGDAPPSLRRHVSMNTQAGHCQTRLQEVICEVLNDVFGNSERSLSMWTSQLKAQMMLRFGSYRVPSHWIQDGSVGRYGETIFFSSQHSHPHDDMRGRVLLPALLGSTMRATGVALKPAVYARAIQDPGAFFSRPAPFTLDDFDGVSSKSKSIQTADGVLEALKAVTGVTNTLSEDIGSASSGTNVPALKSVMAQTGAKLNMRDEGDKMLAQIPMPYTVKPSVSAKELGADVPMEKPASAAGGQLPESEAPAWQQYSQMCSDVFGTESQEAVAAGLRLSEELFREGRSVAACAVAERAAAPVLSNPSAPTESVVSILAWIARCKEQSCLLGDALERY